MRMLMAIGVGLLTGLATAIAFIAIVVRNARRNHPDAIHVGVGVVPTLLMALVGFGVGFLWMMRR